MSLSVSARNAYKASDAGVVVHPEGWRTRERENPLPRIAPISFAVLWPLTQQKCRGGGFRPPPPSPTTSPMAVTEAERVRTSIASPLE